MTISRYSRLLLKTKMWAVYIIPASLFSSMLGLLAYFLYPFTAGARPLSLENLILILALCSTFSLINFQSNIIQSTLPRVLKDTFNQNPDDIL